VLSVCIGRVNMKNTKRRDRPRKSRAFARRRGAALLEFALVVPILLLILIGIIEFGWMEKNQLTLANATREGARDAAVGFSTEMIRTRVQNRASSIPGAPAGLEIAMQRDNGSEADGYSYDIPLGDKPPNATGTVYNDAPGGCLVRIQVSIRHRALTGFPLFAGRALKTEVTMRRESGR